MSWPEVALAAVNAAQVIALAFIYRNARQSQSSLREINGNLSRAMTSQSAIDREALDSQERS